MLEARGVWVTLGGHALLAGIDLSVAPRRVTALIGPNGAGKSTLLRVLSGEIAPTRGDARLDGLPLSSFSAAQLASRRAVVPQASVVAFPFTVREVVMLGMTVPGFPMPAQALRERSDAALQAVGLLAFADRFYPTLSGGERQRVHIARALCQLATARPTSLRHQFIRPTPRFPRFRTSSARATTPSPQLKCSPALGFLKVSIRRRPQDSFA